jgi:hypothetical protein
MRKVFLIAAIVVACAKKEAPPADTATPAPPPPPPPPPAPTAADVAGTWNGTSSAEGDTTKTQWTITSTSDSTGKLTFTKTKQTVDYTVKLSGDSLVATSNKPYNDPSMPKGSPKVNFHSIGRLKDGKMVGIAHLMLASKPDSVLGTANWEATKAP